MGNWHIELPENVHFIMLAYVAGDKLQLQVQQRFARQDI
jgi:hypothetical protein